MTDKKVHRQPKTPKQRAQEQLDVANRLVIRLDKKVDRLRGELVVLERERDAAIARRDHLRIHPDLATPTPTAKEQSA